MAIQKILSGVQDTVKKLYPSAKIKRIGNKAVSQISIKMPNRDSALVFASANGSYGAGVHFADTGVSGITGRVMINGKLRPFHAQVNGDISKAYGEISAILKEYQAGKCKDVTKEVLSGKY